MNSSISRPTTTLTATCACKTFNLTLLIPTSFLPYERALCLCSRCRHFSGSTGISFLEIPNYTLDPSSCSLTAYPVSERTTRYFCSTCGAHTNSYLSDLKVWTVATGLLDRTEGILKWTGCKYIESTLDGGVSVWLNSITDADGTKRELKRWMGQDEEGEELVPVGALQKFTPPPAPAREERLNAACHCGGVKFYITRPNTSSKTARSPFPDLMIPFHTGASAANPENKPWWLRANDTKYLAGTCTCTSCRVAAGFEIQPWAFVPKCNIFQEDGRPMDYGMGTLKRYDSAAGVWREFCSVCGATVFWHCAERPTLVDVSVGLLDDAEGARAERWLEWWTERVSFEELAVSKSLVRSLEEGLKGWGEGAGR